jgi:hypothetical protein
MGVSDFYVAPQMKENPFYYDGIRQDEYLTEYMYYHECIAERFKNGPYKPLVCQLRDGEIDRIPEKYKRFCLDPNWDSGLKNDLKQKK